MLASRAEEAYVLDLGALDALPRQLLEEVSRPEFVAMAYTQKQAPTMMMCFAQKFAAGILFIRWAGAGCSQQSVRAM